MTYGRPLTDVRLPCVYRREGRFNCIPSKNFQNAPSQTNLYRKSLIGYRQMNNTFSYSWKTHSWISTATLQAKSPLYEKVISCLANLWWVTALNDNTVGISIARPLKLLVAQGFVAQWLKRMHGFVSCKHSSVLVLSILRMHIFMSHKSDQTRKEC